MSVGLSWGKDGGEDEDGSGSRVTLCSNQEGRMGRVEHLLKPERAVSDTADGPGRMMGDGCRRGWTGVGVFDILTFLAFWKTGTANSNLEQERSRSLARCFLECRNQLLGPFPMWHPVG